MDSFRRSCLCCLVLGLFIGCQEGPHEPAYKSIALLGINIAIDGELDEKIWEQAYWENGFSFPWETMEVPATAFCSVSSKETFYFAFKVEDEDIVYAAGPDEDEKGVAKGDRVEIFFSKDNALSDYYCLEISPKGRVLDYQAEHYRQFDHSWECEGLQVSTKILENGYQVEGAIPFSTFDSLGLIGSQDNNRIFMGLYRGEFSHGPDDSVVPRWISWIVPDAETPDFHIPSSFGYLEL